MRRILLTNIHLGGRSGTETHSRDLVREWRRRGHRVGVLTRGPRGPIADEMVALGAEVVTEPRALSFAPEIIHGHHNLMAAVASAAFPSVPAIWVCHDAVSWLDRAPRLPGIVLYAAVDELCRRRVAADLGLPLEQVAVVGNSVDLDLFQPRGPLPPRPRRAAVFNNYASEANFLPAVRAACETAGLELTILGGAAGRLCATPWLELPKFDVVFAKARCAMEAMSAGCAVVLCGVEGAGPLVTAENFAELRRWNFGRHCLTAPVSPATLTSALAGYEARAAEATGALARTQLGLAGFGEAWETHHTRVLHTPTPVFPSCTALDRQHLLLSLRARWYLQRLLHRGRRLAPTMREGIWGTNDSA